MLVLGVDVGLTTGLCLLDMGGRNPSYVAGLSVEHDLTRVLDSAFFGAYDIEIIGVETPTQVFEHGRARLSKQARVGIERSLLASTPMVGVVRAVAQLRAPAATIHEGQAHIVRRAVLGRLPKAGVDAFVRRMVVGLVSGWPSRSNSHVRDAAIAGLYAWHRSRIYLRRRAS